MAGRRHIGINYLTSMGQSVIMGDVVLALRSWWDYRVVATLAVARKVSGGDYRVVATLAVARKVSCGDYRVVATLAVARKVSCGDYRVVATLAVARKVLRVPDSTIARRQGVIEKRPNQRLKYERELRGWARGYVAERLQIDLQTIARWERGTTSPSPQLRQKLCELFGMNAEELGLLKDEPQNQVPLEDPAEGCLHHPPDAARLATTPISSEREFRQEEVVTMRSAQEWPPMAVRGYYPLSQPARSRFPVRTLIISIVVVLGILLWLSPPLHRLLAPPITPGTGNTQTDDALPSVSSSQNTLVRPNALFTLSVTVKNTGHSTWSDQGSYGLTCIVNCMGAGNAGFAGQSVPPEQSWVFSIKMVAPSASRQYLTTWVMEHNDLQFGSTMSITVTVKILPGGMWVDPQDGHVVEDIVHFTAQAYPTVIGDPLIAYVNFTIHRQDSGAWDVACVAHSTADSDIFACDASLSQMHESPGNLRISFDVYDFVGNVNFAPHGERTIVYSPK